MNQPIACAHVPDGGEWLASGMNREHPIRLAIVDDERFVIDNLCDYFSMDENVEVVLTAGNGEEALKKLDEVAVDVVLSDIHMPRMGGIALLWTLQQRLNPPAFIAMTGVDTDGSMLETLAGGGAGYIIKSDPVENIQRAITDALKGGTSLAPECLSRLVNYIPLASAEEVSRQQSSATCPTSWDISTPPPASSWCLRHSRRDGTRCAWLCACDRCVYGAAYGRSKRSLRPFAWRESHSLKPLTSRCCTRKNQPKRAYSCGSSLRMPGWFMM